MRTPDFVYRVYLARARRNSIYERWPRELRKIPPAIREIARRAIAVNKRARVSRQKRRITATRKRGYDVDRAPDESRSRFARWIESGVDERLKTNLHGDRSQRSSPDVCRPMRNASHGRTSFSLTASAVTTAKTNRIDAAKSWKRFSRLFTSGKNFASGRRAPAPEWLVRLSVIPCAARVI